MEGTIPDAIDCYEETLFIYQRAGYAEGAAVVCSNLFDCYRLEKNYTKANQYLYQFKMELNRIPSLFYNEHNARHRWLSFKRDFEKALAYYEANSFDTAIDAYLEVITKMGPADTVNYNLLAPSFAALGAMYSHMDDYPIALQYFDKMWSLGKQFADTTIILKALNNKAALLINNQELGKGLSVAQEALAIARKANNLEMENASIGHIGIVLIGLQQPEEALVYSKKSLNMAQQLLNHRDIIQAQYLLGYNYNQLQEYKKAEKHLLSGLESASLINYGIGIEKAYDQLSAAYEGMGAYNRALQYKKKYAGIRDSLRGAENAQRIASTEARYRVAYKDKELAEKDKVLAENKATLYRQRFSLTISLGIGLLLFFTLLGYIRHSKQKRRLHREQIQNLNQQKQIEQLQVKMEAEEQERRRIAQELHDGLGVLLSAAKINHNLLAKALPGAEAARSYHESRQILAQMQEEVQTITNNLVPDYITQHGLEGALHTLALKFDRPEAFKVQVQTYGQVRELHPDRSFSLFRIIEEIIHNAVKHSGGHTLMIQLMYHEDQLHITLDDNGAGFDTDYNYSGMGLQNIRNRVKALQGYLNLSSRAGKGTTYILEIPY